MTNVMPAIFFGHGNPMNALLHNAYTDGWASIGKSTCRRRARFTISPVFHANCMTFSIPLQAVRNLQRVSNICYRRFRSSLTRVWPRSRNAVKAAQVALTGSMEG